MVTDGQTVKFGVTGNQSDRLYRHTADGLATVLRLITGLTEHRAKHIEDECKIALKNSGATPVRGREYFHAVWTSKVLAIVDLMA